MRAKRGVVLPESELLVGAMPPEGEAIDEELVAEAVEEDRAGGRGGGSDAPSRGRAGVCSGAGARARGAPEPEAEVAEPEQEPEPEPVKE